MSAEGGEKMTLPFENDTSAVIQKLTGRSLKVNKRRNLFLVIAIMLTTLLIGFVFSVGMSLVESVKLEQIRLAGTMAHAAVGHPTASQIEQLHDLDYVKAVGTGNSVGYVENTAELGNISLTLHYFDETEWEELRAPAYVDVEGSYPEKENEIMVSRAVLERMGIDAPSIGMEIPLAYYTDSDKEGPLMEENFCLSGWFTSYASVQSADTADVIFVSQALSEKYGKTVEKDGSASVKFVDEAHISEYCDALVSDLGLSENQPIATVQLYDTSAGQEIATLLSLCAVAAFLIFTGYLLIYNILYISISRDVRFYGLLKTLGATPRQIKRVVRGQILRLCCVGIPVGIVLSLALSLGMVPSFISTLDAVSADGAVVSFSPLIYVGLLCFLCLQRCWVHRNQPKSSKHFSHRSAEIYGSDWKHKRCPVGCSRKTRSDGLAQYFPGQKACGGRIAQPVFRYNDVFDGHNISFQHRYIEVY